MRYPLLLRFQGTLVGSHLGENGLSAEQLASQQLVNRTKIGIETTEILLSPEKLLEFKGEKLADPSKNWLNWEHIRGSSQAAIALTPVSLMFHEKPSLLKDKIEQVLTIGEHPDHILEDALIWGYAIALALKEELIPDRFISQILDWMKTAKTPLLQQLVTIEKFLARNASLEEVVSYISHQHQPSQGAIALAFYCFGYTPEDFRLCLLRTLAAQYQPQITGALVGALAGAYNSFSAIPINWRILSHKQSSLQYIYYQSERLFALWSGVYQPSSQPIPASVAVASPQVIQPRSSLKIISQNK